VKQVAGSNFEDRLIEVGPLHVSQNKRTGPGYIGPFNHNAFRKIAGEYDRGNDWARRQSERSIFPACNDRRSRAAAIGMILFLLGILGGLALAQELDVSDVEGSTPSDKPSLPSLLKSEARRYVTDGGTILLAPIHWDRGSWTQAALAIASIALLSQEDSRIDTAFQRNRSAKTDSFSSVVRPFGSYAGIGVSVVSLGGGLLFKNSEWRDTGRDAVEAELFAAGIVTPVLKQVVGRFRPSQGSDADEFHSFSGSQSFPSGESTEAFAVASVFAARSRGWIVPVVAYTLASSVALARMNDHAHFASDVIAGAFIGTAIGHSIVHRHSADSEKRLSWNLVPVTSQRGVGIGIRIETGSR
jgi:membrane-associated phospholipid phosphatase